GAVAVGAAVCLARPPGWLVSPWSWAGLPLVVAGVALAAPLLVGLRRARTAVLVGGVAAASLVLLGWTAHYHAAWVNHAQDFPLLATRVERHARGGDIAVYGGRYFPLAFYLAPPAPPGTPEAAGCATGRARRARVVDAAGPDRPSDRGARHGAGARVEDAHRAASGRADRPVRRGLGGRESTLGARDAGASLAP